MRTGIADLRSPQPFIATMPSVYWGDPLAEELCEAFDDLIAPIFATLDCLPAYLDPRTAPADMLDWLAGWIGLTVGGRDPAHKRHLIVAGSATLRWQGTAQSIHDAVVAAFDRDTEVIESGSATWSLTPDSRPGGQPVPSLLVRVTVNADAAGADDEPDIRSIDALVDAIKPAHIPHRIELVPRTVPAVVASRTQPATPGEEPSTQILRALDPDGQHPSADRDL